MFEESVCLLLRASWFKPLPVEEHVEHEDIYDYIEDYYDYEDEEDDLDDAYYGGSSSIRIGNRRWGDNGYVRAGRQQARPIHQPNSQNSGASSSREPRNKEAVKDAATTGRRAKRALKREAADKAAAVKHQQHLVRLGRK
ncbi:RING/U-box superfamily protein isoform 1 [Senna tora]|uniref:RING/U-box superfamily protein isoform 1 n=1 Tax=Senna tora TaxID=362788 RepID=A0A834T7Y5_9FABA|nr:RING/U-box superfamily protein isoform 1 [Senna tora]